MKTFSTRQIMNILEATQRAGITIYRLKYAPDGSLIVNPDSDQLLTFNNTDDTLSDDALDKWIHSNGKHSY